MMNVEHTLSNDMDVTANDLAYEILADHSTTAGGNGTSFTATSTTNAAKVVAPITRSLLSRSVKSW